MAIAIFSSFLQHHDANGDPLSGGTITVQDAGTTNSRNIYSDTALSVAASNPITLDSAGRHDMRYTAATAYKIILKNSAGTTIDTWDNIDPGVPIGAGYLAIANGGTGATTANAALAALGGATAAELSDLASDVATIDSALSSNEKFQIATGTTAQRPGTPAEGQIRRNTTTSEYEGYGDSDWENFKTSRHASTAAAIAAKTAEDTYIRPDRLSNAPGVAKAWTRCAVSGGSLSVTSGDGGFSGTVRNSAGNYTATLATAMANANWAPFINAIDTAGSVRTATIVSTTATTVNFVILNASGTATDPLGFVIEAMGASV